MTEMALMSAAAWVGSTGTLVATLPASRAAGNLLLGAATINDGTNTFPGSVDGWGNPIAAFNGNVRAALYGRICTNTSADNLVLSIAGGARKHVSMACFTGDVFPNIASIVHANSSRATSSNSTSLNCGGLGVTSDDCTLIAIARRQVASACSLQLAGPASPNSINYWRDGTSMLSAWAWKQQTAATDIADDDIKWNILPGDSTAYSTYSLVVALRTGTAGQVHTETIADTLVPSDGIVKSVSAGLAWSAVPAITSRTGSAYTVQAGRASTSVLYGVAVVRSSTPPSVAQIKAGQNGGGQPAAAVNTSASGTGNVSLTLTPSLNPAFPLYDLHFALSDGALDSDRQSVLGQLLDPTSGHLFRELASVSATGPLAGTLAAPGDVWVTAAVTSGSGAYAVTLLDTADFQIGAAGDTDRVQFTQKLYDWSAAQYEGPGTVYVNNAPPTPASTPIYPAGLLIEQNATMTPVDLVDLAPDPEADTVSVTKTAGSWPTGLALGGAPDYTLSGTPLEYGEWNVTLRWTDSLGEHYDETFDVVTGPRLPDVFEDTLVVAQGKLALASLTLAYDHEYHPTIPADSIVSQVPAAATVVRYDAQVVLTVSLGPEP